MKKNSVIRNIIVVAALMWMCVGCGTNSGDLIENQVKNIGVNMEETSEEKNMTYTVTFQSGEDTLDNVVITVEDGEAAIPPDWSLPFKELTGWSQDISHVTQNMTVTAQWSDVTMSGVEISEYAETRTVTVRVHDVYGNNSSGSGFFIDDEGTLITNYHVIEYADSFEVQLANAVYEVKKIINFSEKYDLAILKVNIEGNDYFTLTNDVKKGEQVYAIGSALGELTDTITKGIVSNTSREVGAIECIQTDASISHGNSGGPLVNEYGQVVGINSFSMTSGSNLNLAIKASMLDKLGEERNYSITDYIEWWKTEISRSYHPTNLSDTNYYQYSLINTYQNYFGTSCVMSMDSLYLSSVSSYEEGYDETYWVFVYEYNQNNYDTYVSYLKELGFVYDPDESGDYDLGVCSTFYSNSSGFIIDLIVTNERSEYETKVLLIRIYY